MDYVDSIKVFTHLADSGNFTRTAEAFDVTASHISKIIQGLELRLNCRLFQRTTRRVRLTEAGDVFLSRALTIIEQLHEIENELLSVVEIPKGLLRITAPASAGSLLENKAVIPAFLSKYPETRIDLELEDRVVDIVAEGYDLAIRGIARMPDSTLVARQIHRFQLVICCSKEYMANFGKPKKIADLEKHSCLLFKAHVFNNCWRLKNGATLVEIPVKGSFLSNSIDAIRSGMLAGQGIALLPKYLVQGEIQRRNVEVLFPSFSSGNIPLYAVYPNRKWVPKKVNLFIADLESSIARTTKES